MLCIRPVTGMRVAKFLWLITFTSAFFVQIGQIEPWCELCTLHYFWLLVLPHYIFLKCYNFLLFKIFFTKCIDINTLQTQEFVYTWLVKIFINCKN
jgi:hypothetical protein